MRLIVHGQQAFGKAVLEALLQRDEEVAAVYCGPDAGSRVDPLKEYALEQGLTVHQPKSYKDPQVWAQMDELGADLCVMAYVTLFVPEEALNTPRLVQQPFSERLKLTNTMSGVSNTSVTPSPLSSVRFATEGVITTSLMLATSIASALAPGGASGGIHLQAIVGAKFPTGGRYSHTSTESRGMQTPRLGSQSSSISQSSLNVQSLSNGTHTRPMQPSPLAQQSSSSFPQSCSGSSHCATHAPSKHISVLSQQKPLHST